MSQSKTSGNGQQQYFICEIFINQLCDGFLPSTFHPWISLPSFQLPSPSFKRQVYHHLRDQMAWFFFSLHIYLLFLFLDILAFFLFIYLFIYLFNLFLFIYLIYYLFIYLFIFFFFFLLDITFLFLFLGIQIWERVQCVCSVFPFIKKNK